MSKGRITDRAKAERIAREWIEMGLTTCATCGHTFPVTADSHFAGCRRLQEKKQHGRETFARERAREAKLRDFNRVAALMSRPPRGPMDGA